MYFKIFKIFIVLLCTFLVACGEEEQQKIITLGTSADYPPFEYRKNGELMGFDIDIAKAYAKEVGAKLKIEDLEFSSLIGALNSNKIDIAVSALSPSLARKKSVDFSEEYYKGTVSVISRKDNKITSFAAMQRKKIGAQLGSVWETMLKEKAKEIENIELFALGRTPQLIEELKVGRIDAVLIDYEQAINYTKANSELMCMVLENGDTGYAAAFKKGSPLRSEFDRFLQKIKNNGELDILIKKWFIVDK
jgi:polar amino acid transport system substrate-binding protein